MIPKRAIDEFLNRDLDDFYWLKSVPEEEIDEALADLDPPFVFHSKPFLHQKICFLIGQHVPEFLNFIDLGCGKTKLTLDLITYLLARGDITKVLVLVPNVMKIDDWVNEEIPKHSPLLKAVALIGTKLEKLELLRSDVHVYVINYDGFVSLVTSLEHVAGRKSRKRLINVVELRKYAKFFDALGLDETTFVKNHRTLIFKACKYIAPACKLRLGLTGVPFGRDLMDLWAQFYIIDQGTTLGRTLGIFRESFFDSKPGYWGGWEYKIKKNLKPKLFETIKSRSIRFSKNECQDLPPTVPIIRTATFPIVGDNLDYYQDAIDDIIQAKGDYTQLKSSFTNMRMITSGYVKLRADDDRSVYIDFK